MNPPTRSRRQIPAVEKVLRSLGTTGLPRAVVLTIVRRELARLRAGRAIPDADAVVEVIRARLERLRRAALRPVINGTGVVIHTNLGRAPLGPAAAAALAAIGANYSNLEFDLVAGQRGERAEYLEHLLAAVSGAEAATVTNNCAAALVLILRHWTAGERREVLISRGELVQIGGGFRIPDVLESSGAQLREVGTTNQTTVADYARAINARTALILKVHRSNFFMDGFVESPATEELAGLARRKRLPLVEDLGSGAVVETRGFGVGHEPTPAEIFCQGVDLVCFSGDKLLGGPQAGVIAGKSRLVAALKREPFYRALRCDKLVLAALQATVEEYLSAGESGGRHKPTESVPSVAGRIPVLAMLAEDLSALRSRAEAIQTGLAGLPLTVGLGRGVGQVGGGTLPRAALESVTLDLRPEGLAIGEFAARLRSGNPPVIGYLSGGRLRLDLRTVFPAQDLELTGAIARAAARAGEAADTPDRCRPPRVQSRDMPCGSGVEPC